MLRRSLCAHLLRHHHLQTPIRRHLRRVPWSSSIRWAPELYAHGYRRSRCGLHRCRYARLPVQLPRRYGLLPVQLGSVSSSNNFNSAVALTISGMPPELQGPSPRPRSPRAREPPPPSRSLSRAVTPGSGREMALTGISCAACCSFSLPRRKAFQAYTFGSASFPFSSPRSIPAFQRGTGRRGVRLRHLVSCPHRLWPATARDGAGGGGLRIPLGHRYFGNRFFLEPLPRGLPLHQVHNGAVNRQNGVRVAIGILVRLSR